jgi:hypothetical protein
MVKHLSVCWKNASLLIKINDKKINLVKILIINYDN